MKEFTTKKFGEYSLVTLGDSSKDCDCPICAVMDRDDCDEKMLRQAFKEAEKTNRYAGSRKDGESDERFLRRMMAKMNL